MLTKKIKKCYLKCMSKYYLVVSEHYWKVAEKASRNNDYVTYDILKTRAIYYLAKRIDTVGKLVKIAQ